LIEKRRISHQSKCRRIGKVLLFGVSLLQTLFRCSTRAKDKQDEGEEAFFSYSLCLCRDDALIKHGQMYGTIQLCGIPRRVIVSLYVVEENAPPAQALLLFYHQPNAFVSESQVRRK
jgi:hypothetical protein